MSKVDKYSGIPTFQERKRFSKSKSPNKRAKGKKIFGVRAVPKPSYFLTNPILSFLRWHIRCTYQYYRTERSRNDAFRILNVRVNGFDDKYVYEKCLRH